MFRVAVLTSEVSIGCIIKGEIHLASLHEASLNTSFGASKPIEAGMMVATCKRIFKNCLVGVRSREYRFILPLHH